MIFGKKSRLFIAYESDCTHGENVLLRYIFTVLKSLYNSRKMGAFSYILY